MTVIIEAPDGTCKEIGGFDIDFGCTSSGFWPSAWNTSTSGSYTGAATIGSAPEGNGVWFIRIGNGWSGSQGAYFSADISVWDLCLDVDPPGCTDPQAAITTLPPLSMTERVIMNHVTVVRMLPRAITMWP